MRFKNGKNISGRFAWITTPFLLIFFFQNCSQGFRPLSPSPISSANSSTGGGSTTTTPTTGGSSDSTNGATLPTGGYDTGGSSGTSALSASLSAGPSRIVSSSGNGYQYSYGPSMIYSGGIYYAYFCSTDNVYGWDKIRVVTSTNLQTWSAPTQVLLTTNSTTERAACDPSVVRASDGYYYLFYGGNSRAEQTVIFVARSTSPTGPFLKYNTAGQWEANATSPKIIVHPKHPVADGSSPMPYGAGQPTVVYRDGVFKMWYMDDSENYPNGSAHAYYLTSTDAVNWSAPNTTNVANESSFDVKYDPATGWWVMFNMEYQHSVGAYGAIRLSHDGINWSGPANICANGSCLPNFANNIGVVGDETGALLSHSIVLGYGGPIDFNAYFDNNCNVSSAPNCWGYWDLYTSKVNLNFNSQTSIPALPAPNGPISYSSIAAGTPISCDYFNPDAIKNLDAGTIGWLAAIQPNGLTLHEQFYVARQQGYGGAFGHGEHGAWLAADPARSSSFNAAVAAMANAPLDGFGTFSQHHIIRRRAGYFGLFLCGGDTCFQSGQCDNLGRRL